MQPRIKLVSLQNTKRRREREKRKHTSSECAFNEPSWNAVLMECPPSHQTKEPHRKRRKPRGGRGVSNERRAKP